MGRRVPSLAVSTVWLAKPTSVPSRSTVSTGLSTGFPVCSFVIRKTTSSGFPRASSCVQAVSLSAAAFMKLTRPSPIGRDHGIADAAKRGRKPGGMSSELIAVAFAQQVDAEEQRQGQGGCEGEGEHRPGDGRLQPSSQGSPGRVLFGPQRLELADGRDPWLPCRGRS